MKLILATASVLLSISLNAQITITSSSMPSSGDTLRYSIENPGGITYAPTGAGYYWDYSTLTSQRQDVYQYKAAMQTPYAFYFIGANKYGLKMADSIGVATFMFYDVYNFFQKTSSVFKTEGTGFKYSGIPLAAYYSDDDELYQFPLNYLDRDSSTYAFSVSLGGNLSYSQRGYRINEVDGWGSIKTPYDSVACLRLISTSYGIDSINVNGFGFSFPNVQRSYKWLASTEKIPVLEISGQYQDPNFTPTQVRYRDRFISSVGIKEQSQSDELIVYPNPSNGLFVISAARSNTAVIIIDMQGKIILEKKLDLGENTFDLNALDLSKGIYQLRIADEQHQTLLTKKLVIQ